jgi:PAS domain S-box-containing protein
MGRRRGNSERERYGSSLVCHLATRLVLLICASLLCILSTATCIAQESAKNVLFVFSSFDQQRRSLNSFENALRARVPQHLNFYASHVDYERMKDASYRDSLAETFHNAYKDVKFDVVVVSSIDALQFVTSYRERIFPGAPIIFFEVSASALEGLQLPPGTTGRTSGIALRQTIDLALRLHSDAQTIAIITESPGFWWNVAHSEVERHRDRVKEVDLFGPPAKELLNRVEALPPHTIILFQLAALSAKESDITPNDVLAVAASHLPTYCAWKSSFILGCVGGAYADSQKHLESTADITARVLSGERADNIPVSDDSNFVTEVDWRELRRWNIPESALPPGTRVSFREPTLWEQGRKYFLTGISVIAVQALLIFTLFWQRARRRKAEIELGKSEEKFSKAFQHSPLAITIVRASDGRYIDVNEIFEASTGWRRDEVVGRTPLEIGLWVNPEQRAAFLRQLLENGTVINIEVKYRRKDGQVRTSLGSAELIEIHGEQCALSVIADITDRKQAEEAMTSVSSRLIAAQEAERTRIARELHDDINQRLAMVAIALDSTKQDLPSSAIKTKRQLEEATEQIGELGDDIQALSHRLHSSRLEYLGLEVAASGFCTEMSERQDVKIDFHFGDIPEDLSDQISLCLFRVLQEALQNAVKYSGVVQFEVSFTSTSGEIELRVHDSGVGFDPAEISTNGHGLGLISMKERLKLVRGELSIDSKPGHGTTVLARVPLAFNKEVTAYSEEKPLEPTNQSVPI